MAKHHPNEEILLDYATGGLSEPGAVLVASHIALAPESRERVREMEAIGGALLESVDLEAPAENARWTASLSDLMAKLDEPEIDEEQPEAPIEEMAVAKDMANFPQPLLDRVRRAGGSWHYFMPGAEYLDLGADETGAHAYLLKVKAGKTMPQHTHEAEEWVMILSGQMLDGDQVYERGDVQVNDSHVDHSPMAGQDEPCICMVVTHGAMKLTGKFGRWLNPLMPR
ncbi:MAG: ChrR family anti-sigma-E factor [Alphaproteobacteria bacterium]|nr:ChrR family anti-sigma-E factor [Alphaproteobacteria bacterium]